jgi:hypothetical protein
MLRFLKQILYGIFFLSFWALVFGGIYLIFLRTTASCFDNRQNQNETGIDCGGSCISCELKALAPLTFSEPLIFENDGLTSLLFEVSNPNVNYGSDNFEYKINFYDEKGNFLQSLDRSSFIFAGETKELVEAGLRLRASATRAEAVLGNINWRPLTGWQPPVLGAHNLRFSLGQGIITVNGIVQNPSNFRVSEAVVTAVALDQFSRPVGVSKTELKNLLPFEERNFQVLIPFNPIIQNQINLEATQISVKGRR